jgi:hypothetical protein
MQFLRKPSSMLQNAQKSDFFHFERCSPSNQEILDTISYLTQLLFFQLLWWLGVAENYCDGSVLRDYC